MALCAECDKPAIRKCSLCRQNLYCGPEHEAHHFIARHKSECSFVVPGGRLADVFGWDAQSLRIAASTALQEGSKAVIPYALGALRANLSSAGINDCRQEQIGDCLLIAQAFRQAQDDAGAGAWFTLAADTVAAYPYTDFSKTDAIFNYIKDACIADGKAAEFAQVTHTHYKCAQQLGAWSHTQAGQALMPAVQAEAQDLRYDTALFTWAEAAAQFEQGMAAGETEGVNAGTVLSGVYKVGVALSIISGQYDYATAVAMRGRDLSNQLLGAAGAAAALEFEAMAGAAFRFDNKWSDALPLLSHVYEARLAEGGEAHEETITARKAMNLVRKKLGMAVVPGPKSKASTSGTGTGAEAGSAAASVAHVLAAMFERPAVNSPTAAGDSAGGVLGRTSQSQAAQRQFSAGGGGNDGQNADGGAATYSGSGGGEMEGMDTGGGFESDMAGGYSSSARMRGGRGGEDSSGWDDGDDNNWQDSDYEGGDNQGLGPSGGGGAFGPGGGGGSMGPFGSGGGGDGGGLGPMGAYADSFNSPYGTDGAGADGDGGMGGGGFGPTIDQNGVIGTMGGSSGPGRTSHNASGLGGSGSSSGVGGPPGSVLMQPYEEGIGSGLEGELLSDAHIQEGFAPYPQPQLATRAAMPPSLAALLSPRFVLGGGGAGTALPSPVPLVLNPDTVEGRALLAAAIARAGEYAAQHRVDVLERKQRARRVVHVPDEDPGLSGGPGDGFGGVGTATAASTASGASTSMEQRVQYRPQRGVRGTLPTLSIPGQQHQQQPLRQHHDAEREREAVDPYTLPQVQWNGEWYFQHEDKSLGYFDGDGSYCQFWPEGPPPGGSGEFELEAEASSSRTHQEGRHSSVPFNTVNGSSARVYTGQPVSLHHNAFAFGMDALGVSAVATGDAEMNAPDGGAPTFASEADAMSFLSRVTDKLSHAVTALTTLATAHGGGGGGRTARWQGDGELAVPEVGVQSLEGKERPAIALQFAIRDAITALARSQGVAETSGLGGAAIAGLRDTLFHLVADAAHQVNSVLRGADIDLHRLDVIATSTAARMPRLNSANSAFSLEAPTGGGDDSELAGGSSRNGTGAGGGGGPGGRSATPQAGTHQPGLYKAEDNPELRRMKAVFMTGEEILTSLQGRLLALGMFKSLGTRSRQRRISLRLHFLGMCAHAGRSRAIRRRSIVSFAAGMLVHAVRRRQEAERSMKVLALGCLKRSIVLRDRSRQATVIFSLGMVHLWARQRLARIRLLRLFASGLAPMLLRTKGAPTGYKYGQKVVKPVNKGPKVKTLFWDTLGDVKGTIWANKPTRAGNILKDLFPDMKELFTEKEVVRKPAAGAGAGADVDAGGDEGATGSKAKRVKPIEFVNELDSKRGYNMGISLAKFKRFEGGFVGLRDALIRMDVEAVGGMESVEVLDTWKPDAKEISRAQQEMTKLQELMRTDPVGPHPVFGYLEQFVYDMSRVPRLPARLQCIKIKSSFAENSAVEENNIAMLQAACHQILFNKNLVEFLVDIIRPFGNELNKGTRKAGAQGVKVSGLMKLSQTKTADNKVTSLYYIVSVLAKHRPHLLELCTEFKAVRAAQRIQLQLISAALKSLKNNVALLEEQVAISNKEGDTNFLDAMESFSVKCKRQLHELDERYNMTCQDFERVCLYLGEDPAVTKPEELFPAWWAFIEVLTSTVNEYRRAKERAEKAARDEQAAIEKAVAKMNKLAAGSSAPKEAVTASPLKGRMRSPQPGTDGRGRETDVAVPVGREKSLPPPPGVPPPPPPEGARGREGASGGVADSATSVSGPPMAPRPANARRVRASGGGADPGVPPPPPPPPPGPPPPSAS